MGTQENPISCRKSIVNILSPLYNRVFSDFQQNVKPAGLIFLENACCIVCQTNLYTGVSVGVSSLTLVTISLERYFAICRPLRSRRWQTVSHSYRMLAAVWACAFVVMIPTAVNQRHRLLLSGAHKCIEVRLTPSRLLFTYGYSYISILCQTGLSHHL